MASSETRRAGRHDTCLMDSAKDSAAAPSVPWGEPAEFPSKDDEPARSYRGEK
jgi:hypothetical protein